MRVSAIRDVSFLVLASLASLASGGCKDRRPASGNSAGAVPAGSASSTGSAATAERHAVDVKMKASIDCINNVGSTVHRLEGDYLRTVDPKKGPMPGASVWIGRLVPEPCVKAATEAIAVKPAVADLDTALGAYVAKLNELAPVLVEANDHYEQKRYLDDKTQKGIAIHPKVMAAFDELDAAALALRAPVEARSRAEREAELAQMAKDPAQHVEYTRGRLLLVAQDLVKLCKVREPLKLDPAPLAAKLAELDQATSAVVSLKLESTDGNFTNAARQYLTAALALERRVREHKPYEKFEQASIDEGHDSIDGSLPQLISRYNSLIQTANTMH